MNKVKKISIVTISAIAAAIIIAVSLLFFVPITKSSEVLVNKDNSDFSIVETSGSVSLAFAETDVFLSGGSGSTGVSKNIIASVNPANSLNEPLIWSVDWASGNTFGSGKNISDYVVIEPFGNNFIECTVTCFAVFEGNITLTVKTSITNISGSATIKYVGIPTNVDFNLSESDYYSKNGDIYYLDVSTNRARLPYHYFNGIGSIAAGYQGTLPTCSFSGSGSVLVKIYAKPAGMPKELYQKTINVPMSVSATAFATGSYGPDNTTKKMEFNLYEIQSTLNKSLVKPYFGSTDYDGSAYDSWSYQVSEITSGAYYTVSLSASWSDVSSSCSLKFLPCSSSGSLSVPGVEF